MEQEEEKIPFIVRLLRGFGYAMKGISHMVATQHNAWIHSGAAVLAVAMGFYFHISMTEWLFIIFSIGLVFTAELFNTAIEYLVDIVSPEKQLKAGKVKDMAAGAVLVAALGALITGCVVFLPKIF